MFIILSLLLNLQNSLACDTFECLCENKGEGYIFDYKNECEKFTICDYNQQEARVLDCPASTIFSNEKKYCVWFYESERLEECMKPEYYGDDLCETHEDGLPFLYPDTCSYFGVCGRDNRVYKYKCPLDLIFNPERMYCDWRYNVEDLDGDNLPDYCDPCPNDYYNDIDGDGLCGDVDPCPYDSENDADGDGLCGDVDPCPYNPENDADGDGLCENVDPCPNDFYNDIDGDGLCGDVDPCPYDIFNLCDQEICETDYDIQLINTGSNFEFDNLFEKAKRKWECIILNELDGFGQQSESFNWFGSGEFGEYNGPVDDIVIGYKVDYIDGPGEGGFNTLGFAGPRYFRIYNEPNEQQFLPISGIMVFDSYDLDAMFVDGVLEGVILHEMGHVLGVGTIWNAKDVTMCSNDDVDNDYPYFTGNAAQNVYNYLGFVGLLPIELDYRPGSRCSHFNENTDSEYQGLGNELMTPLVDDVMILSDITISSLQDLGYSVDHSKAEDFGPSLVNRRRSIGDKYSLRNDTLESFLNIKPEGFNSFSNIIIVNINLIIILLKIIYII